MHQIIGTEWVRNYFIICVIVADMAAAKIKSPQL